MVRLTPARHSVHEYCCTTAKSMLRRTRVQPLVGLGHQVLGLQQTRYHEGLAEGAMH